jgi:hypothetical protein
MANQGYNPYFLVFLMGVPIIIAVIWGVYMSYVKKTPMSKIRNIYCFSVGINTIWVAWFLGYRFVIVLSSGLLFFFLAKLYLITLKKSMIAIHNGKIAEDDMMGQAVVKIL